MALEGLLEPIPSYSMPSLHRLEMVPPHQSFSQQLQSCEVGFVLLGARQHKGGELRLYGLIQASASRGSSALEKIGDFIAMN
jgi:hypothetical protein